MKRIIPSLFLAGILFISCAACGNRTENLHMAGMGETFSSLVVVQNGSKHYDGYLNYTINSIQWSDNIKELGIEPSQLDEYSVVDYEEGAGYVYYAYPDYVIMETGQLVPHLRFVLVDLTVTNIDALSKPIPENDNGVRDATWYTFGVNRITACDLNVEKKDHFGNFDVVWYAGTGNYDPAEGGTNGSNYFILRPGESLSYQLGIIVGSAEDDFSRMCLTDKGGNYAADEAVYVPLGMD